MTLYATSSMSIRSFLDLLEKDKLSSYHLSCKNMPDHIFIDIFKNDLIGSVKQELTLSAHCINPTTISFNSLKGAAKKSSIGAKEEIYLH